MLYYLITFSEQIHREAVRLCAGRRLKISLLKKVTAAAALARKVRKQKYSDFKSNSLNAEQNF